MRTIAIFNGPNLNMLGKREQLIYGNNSLESIRIIVDRYCGEHGYSIDFRQTNSESELVTWIQELSKDACGLLINPAAYTHTSVAIRDALLLLSIPTVEVHLSNTYKRERFRQRSLIADVVWGRIVGLGYLGYLYGAMAIIERDQEIHPDSQTQP